MREQMKQNKWNEVLLHGDSFPRKLISKIYQVHVCANSESHFQENRVRMYLAKSWLGERVYLINCIPLTYYR